jgi:hypothetical protein
MLGEVGNGCFIGDAASLGKAIQHAITNFDVGKTFVDKISQIVLSEDAFGDEVDRDFHIFIAGNVGDQVKVFDVKGHEQASIVGGDDTVEYKFGGGRLTVLVLALPGQSMWSPPTVQWVWQG